MPTIDERFYQLHPGSAASAREARDLFPDGVTHDVRYISPFPLYMTHASGPYKWDVDGNRYLDYVIGHGAMILGHGNPQVVAAIASQAAKGTHLGGSTELEKEWGRQIKRLVPCAEKIRFVASGTEASLMAFRLARAFTGKDKIAKFSEHFHGWHDYVVKESGDASPAGVPQATLSTVEVLPPDLKAVEQLFQKDKDIAAIILEPTGAHGGQLPIKPDFLRGLRQLTKDYGVLLIFDEVVTGFRVSKGGAQLRYGVTPDMSTHAKILAGGLPGGAVVGKADIIDMIQHKGDPQWDKSKRVAHPGTFNANPLSAAAGGTALRIIAEEPINDHCDAMTRRLRDGIQQVLNRLEIPGTCYGVASMLFITFAEGEVDDEGWCNLSHAEIKKGSKPQVVAALRKALLNEGVDTQGGRIWRMSAAHQPQDVDRSIEGFEKAIAAVRKDGLV